WEQDTWVLDAEINDHGVCIDAPLAAAAFRLATQAHSDLNERMRHETDGAVDAATKNEKLKAWLASQGVKLPHKLRKGELRTSLDADDIEKLLAEDLPHQGVRAALEIRLQAAQSAASKIERMLRTRCADGRVRGLFRFHGATTGRWSGAGFQPQNLKRPELLQTDEAIAEAIEIVKAENYTTLKERYGDVPTDLAFGCGRSSAIMSGPTTLSRTAPTRDASTGCSTCSTSSPMNAWRSVSPASSRRSM